MFSEKEYNSKLASYSMIPKNMMQLFKLRPPKSIKESVFRKKNFKAFENLEIKKGTGNIKFFALCSRKYSRKYPTYMKNLDKENKFYIIKKNLWFSKKNIRLITKKKFLGIHDSIYFLQEKLFVNFSKFLNFQKTRKWEKSIFQSNITIDFNFNIFKNFSYIIKNFYN